MVRTFLLMVLAMLTLLCSVSYADEKPAPKTYGLRYDVPITGTGERVLILPQDENKFYVCVIGDPADAQYQRVADWFNNHPKLKAIKDKVHFHLLGTDTTMYRERFARSTPGTPLVRLQAANGTVLYSRAGAKIPASPEMLYAEIDAECFRRWNQNCPRPQPQPDPVPQPEPVPVPEPRSDLPPWWMMLLSFVVGVGAGVAVQYKDTYYGEAA